jgi:tRNA threonylcarbamoyladenosine biosynthesis protein TsaB
MPDRPHNLAIECSGRVGSIALGKGDVLLASSTLAATRRHNVELIAGIDRLCREHGVGPGDVGEVYVSIGPGSFTGLRVSLATVKMLALAQQMRVVAVATLDVLAQNAPQGVDRVAACLNVKGETMYCGVFERVGDRMVLRGEAKLRRMEELLAQAGRPVAVLGEKLPDLPQEWMQGVTVLAEELAVPQSEVLWRLGRQGAKAGHFADPLGLVPLYVREPEAVQLWEQNQARRAEQARGRGKA